MATPLKEPQGKILFKRTDIRTMKKDIKMLRELDAHKESQKIMGTVETACPVLAKKIIPALKTPAPKQIAPAKPEEKALEQIALQDTSKMMAAKQYANEQEKQQIFALESQIAGLKKQ